jgi:lysophospholipase L1-like esterase
MGITAPSRGGRSIMRHRGLVGVLAAVLAATLPVAPAVASATQKGGPGRDDRGQRWTAAWGASPVVGSAYQFPGVVCQAGAGVTDQTVRDVIFTSVGGDRVRVRLTNSFGSQPLTVSSASIAVDQSGAQPEADTVHPLTFAGAREVTVPPGAEALSDPVSMDVPALRDLLVSVFVPGTSGPATNHFVAQQDNYLSTPGDFTLDASPAPFTTVNECSFFVDGVSVLTTDHVAGAVIALGDSITDGLGSTVNANRRWPNDLARQLDARPGPDLSVVDEGIAGNMVLTDSGSAGVNTLARLDRDVFGQPGARDVILLEGINDIGNGHATASQLIQADEQIITQVHARGLRIFGGTLTPFQGAAFWTAAGEQTREAVNQWILTSGAFDGVINFASAVADPADPLVLNPAFDSGDHLHPNDAGYQAMANAINLAELFSQRPAR